MPGRAISPGHFLQDSVNGLDKPLPVGAATSTPKTSPSPLERMP